jgi:hypothetical protein
MVNGQWSTGQWSTGQVTVGFFASSKKKLKYFSVGWWNV